MEKELGAPQQEIDKGLGVSLAAHAVQSHSGTLLAVFMRIGS